MKKLWGILTGDDGFLSLKHNRDGGINVATFTLVTKQFTLIGDPGSCE